MFSPEQMVEEEMEGEVVMLRLGADGGELEADGDGSQGSTYMQLKPSTTLLVPLELVEGQHDLLDSAQLDLPELQETAVPEDPRCDAHSDFSLMLDMDEVGDKEANMLSIKTDLQSTDTPTHSPLAEAADEPVAKPELILLGTEDQDAPLSGEASEEDERKEIDTLDGIVLDSLVNSELQTDIQREHTETNQKMEDPEKHMDAGLVVLTEESESVTPSVSDPTPVEELQAVEGDNDSEDPVEIKGAPVEEKVEEEEEDKPTAAEEKKLPEENGPVEMEEVDHIAETVMSVEEEEQQQHDYGSSADTEEDNKEEEKETESKRTTKGSRKNDDAEEEKPVQHPEEKPVPQTPTSQRKKKAPSTPTRRTTRASRTVSFISPLTEEPEVPEEDGNVEEAETSSVVPASPSRTPRRGRPKKETKVQHSPTRRSTRRAQPEPSANDAKQLEATNNDTVVASTSITSSPARRRASQRAASRTSGQKTQSGSEEVPTATEVEIKMKEQKDEVMDKKVSLQTSSKASTPAKRRTTQVNTPRRSSRRVLSSSEVTQSPLEMVKEEKEQEEEVFASPVKRSTRKMKMEPPQEEEEGKKRQASSPGRTTCQSNRISLNVNPQVRVQESYDFVCKL